MLHRIEALVRWAGGLAMLGFVAALLAGLRSAEQREKGRRSGSAPAALWSVWFYAPASVLGLWLMRLLWRPLALDLPAQARSLALGLGALLYFPGVALMLWGRLALGRMYNVSSGLGAQLFAKHQLVTSGPFSIVRHPMYLGGTLAELGALLIYRTWATLLIALLNPPALAMRARREEQALAAEFGQEWVDYCRRVPACFPRVSG
jgi:protein-S-isoprenylcysteine O-methyltransferase Ste14